MVKNKDYDKKILRVWSILNKLDRGSRVSSQKLAEEFGVSVRTIQRDISLLNMSGFPIYAPEKGYHKFFGDFSLKRVELSKREASLLSFLYEIAKSMGKNFEESFHGIFKKVLSREMESPFYVKIPGGAELNETFPFFRDLQQTIEEWKKIELVYTKAGGDKTFLVHPLKLIFFDGFWYLLCRTDDKGHIIKLRLDRIKNVTITKDSFEGPENLKTLLDESVNVWFDEKRDRVVTLKIDGEVAHFFRQKKYFPLQKIIKVSKDGALTIDTKVSSYMEVTPTILRWLPHIKIVAPKELKEEIKSRVETYLKGK